MRPHIEKQRCNGCGECVDTCPYDVFLLEKGEIVVMNPEDCIECLSCVEQCTEKAIYMDD